MRHLFSASDGQCKRHLLPRHCINRHHMQLFRSDVNEALRRFGNVPMMHHREPFEDELTGMFQRCFRGLAPNPCRVSACSGAQTREYHPLELCYRYCNAVQGAQADVQHYAHVGSWCEA